MKPFISLCMIVKNEEKVLQRCLESVIDEVDEIVIVDTGSTDKTKEIALNYVEKVYEFEWTNSFSDARNFAQLKASGEWILVMDADEYVDSENLKDSFQEIRQLKNEYDAFEVKIFNFSGNRAERIVQHHNIRIYKNDPSISYYRTVHEQLGKGDGDLIVGSANLILYHTGYLIGVVKEKNKNKRNQHLLEKEIKNSGNKGFDYFNLGNEYQSKGEIENALESYLKAYKEKIDVKYSWVSFCLVQIVNCLIKLKRYGDALSILRDAEGIYNQSPDFKCLKGLVYMEQHRYDDAIEVLEEIINHREKYKNTITSIDFNEYHPHQLLATIYELQKNNTKAVYHSVKALNVNKQCRKSLFILLKVLSKYSGKEVAHSFIEEHNLIRNNDDLFSIIKIFLNLNESDLALKYIEMLENQPVMKQGFEIKVNLINGELESLIEFFKTKSVEELSAIIKYGCIDIYDLISFSLLSKQVNISYLLYNLASENNFKALINFLVSESVNKDLRQEDMLQLMERTIQLNQYELFEDLLSRLSFFNNKIYMDLGHLLYKYNFSELGSAFYQELDFKDYEAQAYVNIISQFIIINEYDDALQFAYNAIQNNIFDFRIFKQAIEILNKKNMDSDKEILLKLGLEIYPDSNWLKDILIFG